jgi:hypothetical protein
MLTRYSWCWCYACWRRRRRRLALTLVILIIAAALAARSHAQSDRARPAPARTVPAPKSSPAGRGSPAGTKAVSLAAAGQDLTWSDFHGIELPASAGAGPRHARRGLVWGFADTPRGALLAAINIAVRTAAQWGTAIFAPTITFQITGPNAAALLRAENSAYAELRAVTGVRPGQPAGRGYAAEAGYRFVAWTPSVAIVDIATSGPSTGGTTVLASTRIQVLWLRGDWRVVAPPRGNWANAATAISSLTSYTIFPGER